MKSICGNLAIVSTVRPCQADSQLVGFGVTPLHQEATAHFIGGTMVFKFHVIQSNSLNMNQIIITFNRRGSSECFPRQNSWSWAFPTVSRPLFYKEYKWGNPRLGSPND